MTWFKRRKPIDPGAEYIAQLNAEATERAANPPPTPYLGLSRPTQYSGPRPTSPSIGDLWINTQNQCFRWSGVEWQIVQGVSADIASHIIAGKITAGRVTISPEGISYHG